MRSSRAHHEIECEEAAISPDPLLAAEVKQFPGILQTAMERLFASKIREHALHFLKPLADDLDDIYRHVWTTLHQLRHFGHTPDLLQRFCQRDGLDGYRPSVKSVIVPNVSPRSKKQMAICSPSLPNCEMRTLPSRRA
jgi:hypothetical protein